MGFTKNDTAEPIKTAQTLASFGNLFNNQSTALNNSWFTAAQPEVLQSQMPMQDYISSQMDQIVQPTSVINNSTLDFSNYNDMIKTNLEAAKYAFNKQKLFDNTPMGKLAPYVKGFSGLASGISSLAGIWSGFQQLDLMKDQVAIAKDKWATTKEEMNRIKGVRKKLTSDYMA